MSRKHQEHKQRFLLDFIGQILGKRQCQCIWHISTKKEPDGIGCSQSDFYNGKNKVAGTYGEWTFICNRCYLGDKKEIDSWSKGRRSFVANVQQNDPAFWEASTKHAGEIMSLNREI